MPIAFYAAGLAGLILMTGCYAAETTRNDSAATQNDTTASAAPASASIFLTAGNAVTPATTPDNEDSKQNPAHDEAAARQIIDRNNRANAEADEVIEGFNKLDAEDREKADRLEAICRKTIPLTSDIGSPRKILECVRSKW